MGILTPSSQSSLSHLVGGSDFGNTEGSSEDMGVQSGLPLDHCGGSLRCLVVRM